MEEPRTQISPIEGRTPPESVVLSQEFLEAFKNLGDEMAIAYGYPDLNALMAAEQKKKEAKKAGQPPQP